MKARLYLFIAFLMCVTIVSAQKSVLTLTKEGKLKSLIKKNKEIKDLTIIGPMNEKDLLSLSLLEQLQTLDLRQAIFPINKHILSIPYFPNLKKICISDDYARFNVIDYRVYPIDTLVLYEYTPILKIESKDCQLYGDFEPTIVIVNDIRYINILKPFHDFSGIEGFPNTSYKMTGLDGDIYLNDAIILLIV